MINVFNDKTNVSYFDTIHEYINYIEENPSKHGHHSSEKTDRDEFTGTHSLEEALDLCKYGDEELSSFVHDQVLKFDNIDTTNKKRQTYINDIVGFTPNVPNYILGVPNNMIRDNRNIIKSKIVNIYINLTAHSGVEADDIKKTAAKYVSAIDRLEKEGYRCNIYVGDCGRERWDETWYSLIVKIKSDREPLNITKMAFPMCHPSMLRRLGFKWIETLPIDFGGGYGSPVDNEKDVRRLLKNIFKEDNMVILSVSHNNGDVGDIVEVLKKRGMIESDR